MATNTVHNCGCHGREEIELSEGTRPMAVLVDEDCCECECSEVELYTSREPDVLLFEEYCEEYADDIVLARQAADTAKTAIVTNAATIITKVNLLLDDHQTIKRELRQGITDIRADIAGGIGVIKDKITGAVSSLASTIASGVATIRADIAAIRQNIEIEECSEEEIYEMFDSNNTNYNQ